MEHGAITFQINRFNRIQTEIKHGEIHLTDCEIQTLLCSVYPNIPYRKVITPNNISDILVNF
jgi:hypothetical protein